MAELILFMLQTEPLRSWRRRERRGEGCLCTTPPPPAAPPPPGGGIGPHSHRSAGQTNRQKLALRPRMRITRCAEARMFTFFSRLDQAEKRTKTKGFYCSCNLYFLSQTLLDLPSHLLGSFCVVLHCFIFRNNFKSWRPPLPSPTTRTSTAARSLPGAPSSTRPGSR